MYQEISIKNLPQISSVEEYRRHLFNTYIEQMFNRRDVNQRYSKQASKNWLIWLANNLQTNSQTVFLIERLQPSILIKKKDKLKFIIGLSLITCLINSISGFVFGFIISGVKSGLVYGSILGFCSGVLSGLVWGVINNQIKPVESLKWSWVKAKNHLVEGLYHGLIVGITIGLSTGIVSWVVYDLNVWLTDSISYGIRAGLSAALLIISMRGLNGSQVHKSTVPNQGIRQSTKNAIFFTLVATLGTSIVATVMDIPIIVSLIFGIQFGIFGAGEACIKHLMLRIVLYSNSYIPWNYACFLNWATEHIFLQKVGGGYIFIHRLLLEHFAAMEINKR